jgi:hypothetical protein
MRVVFRNHFCIPLLASAAIVHITCGLVGTIVSGGSRLYVLWSAGVAAAVAWVYVFAWFGTKLLAGHAIRQGMGQWVRPFIGGASLLSRLVIVSGSEAITAVFVFLPGEGDPFLEYPIELAVLSIVWLVINSTLIIGWSRRIDDEQNSST